MDETPNYHVVLLAEAPSRAELTQQLREANARQEVAQAIECALRAAGQPYDAWIVAANAADRHADEATRLVGLLYGPISNESNALAA